MIRTATVVSSFVGAGLEREALLLKDLLEFHKVEVTTVHYTDTNQVLPPTDVTIFFEVVMPRALGISPRNYLFPNSEWWPSGNDQFLPQFTKILCKTKHCQEIWSAKVGADKCIYTSFEARDLYNPIIARENKFLHVAGRSEYKNTAAVIQAWRTGKNLPPLTVVAQNPLFLSYFNTPSPGSPIQFYSKVQDLELAHLMNSHRFHIIPSMYEGFGHVIHEGLGCNAEVITTDAPPMNTYDGLMTECLIPVSSKKPKGRSLVELNVVNAQDVGDAAFIANSLIENCFERQNLFEPREAFLRNRDFFRQTIMEVLQ